MPADALVLEVGLGRPLRRDQRDREARASPASRRSRSIIRNFWAATLARIAVREGRHPQARRARASSARRSEDARDVIVREADQLGAPLFVFGQDFAAHEEHGRLVYQDEDGLLDLPLPKLPGRHQIGNAAIAIAALRHIGRAAGRRDSAIERGLRTVEWPARMQRLSQGAAGRGRAQRRRGLARRRAQSALRGGASRRPWPISKSARPSRSISSAAC